MTVIGPKALAGSVTKLREGSLDEVARADGLLPDVEIRRSFARGDARLDSSSSRRDGHLLHQQPGALDATADVVFRVAGKQPELWDAVTGRIRDLSACRDEAGRTVVPLQFAPRQSWFVVFEKPMAGWPRRGPETNFPELKACADGARAVGAVLRSVVVLSRQWRGR